MHQDRKDKKKAIYRSTFSGIEKMHPYKMFLYLVIVSTSFIFLFLILAFQFSDLPYTSYEYFRFPRPFVVSTIILLISSFQISKVNNLYKSDDIKGLMIAIGSTFVFGVLYIVIQYFGWIDTAAQGIIFTGMAYESYLLVVIGLNMFHFVGGLIFLGYSYYHLLKTAKDPINNLILFTNPFEKMKLELMSTYWHFINILWMGTFFYFLFAF